ncbi:alpha-L-fucosidase [Algibacter sp. L3A6]|uniref:alpha-L-fucosidase n=1 Tax=Algibacter sp. L3A6 TaxID=2686366 RepID=UPI00131DEF11|nr:alpha-L-fucosidase [Algibacter sp. L3A6]
MKLSFYISLILACFVGGAATAQSNSEIEEAAKAQAEALGQSGIQLTSQNRLSEAQWFPDAGLGLFIHWGMAAVQGKGGLSWTTLANRPWWDYTTVPNDYYALMEDWKAPNVDYDTMLAAAKAAGFTYAVFTTKHHDGFTLWPTEYGEIGTKHTFDGRDFVQEFVNACRKHGLKVGFYYSPPDWYFEREYRSWSFDRKVKLDMNHKQVDKLPKMSEKKQEEGRNLVRQHLTELLTNYGKIDLMWFDGGKGQLPNDKVRELQPGIVINARNNEPGDFGHSEGKLPEKRFNTWFETCTPLWPMRFWSYQDNFPHADAAFTLTNVSCLRAWGGNLLANVGPKGDGETPEEAIVCWNKMAEWMKHSSEAVYEIMAGPWPEKCNQPITLSKDGKNAYIHFLPKLPESFEQFPSQMQKLRKTKDMIPTLPEYTNTVIWKDVPRPNSAVLLRTGEKIVFKWKAGTLTLTLPDVNRSGLVDVVKLSFK